jgi:hypothetical protein
VETRLGGVSANNPDNLSTTYAWVGVTAPVTEQYQFLGDPRHCPYQDVKAANGYNWYFTQVPAAYSGFSQTAAGWGTYNCDIDVPRFYQIYRSGLLKTSAIWTAMNGCSYFYYGLGGEFGGNQYPSAKGIPFIQTPWSTT